MQPNTIMLNTIIVIKLVTWNINVLSCFITYASYCTPLLDPGGCWYVGGHPPIPYGPPQLSLSVFSVSLIIVQFTIFSSFSGPKLPEPF